MAEKPNYSPKWANDHAIQDSSTANGDNQYDAIEPGQAKRDEGYDYKEVPPYETDNAMYKIWGLWHKYFEGITDYIAHRIDSGVVTPEDWSLEALALKVILQDDQNDSQMQSAAPQSQSLYLGNLTKAAGRVELRYRPSDSTFDLNWVDSYNIDEASSAWNTGSDPNYLQLAFDEESNWSTKSLEATIGHTQGGLVPPVLVPNTDSIGEISIYHWDGANTAFEALDATYLNNIYSGTSFYTIATINFHLR